MSTSKLTADDALALLSRHNAEDTVIEHCLSVSSLAKAIAEKIKANGHDIDVEFVETAALLHDIGRAKTHDIRHGIEGAKMMKKYPAYARVCESHIGGGITKKEAKELGLPGKDYIPKTLEEKVVCYADKLLAGSKRITLEESLEKYEEKLGPDHPTIDRICRLHLEIRKLVGEPI